MWWIFLVANACEFILTAAIVLGSASGASAASGTDWADVITILVGSSALITILVSRPMRVWVRPSAVV